MTQYARLDSMDPRSVRDIIDLSPEQYAALAGNPKQALLRPLVVDPKPTEPTGQIAEQGALIVEATQVRVPWVVRAMTTAEVEAAALRDELAALNDRIADIQAQRAVTREQWDAYTANQLRAEQWRDRQALLRAAHILLRLTRRGI